MSNHRSLKNGVFIAVALLLAACGGKSNVSGEVVPIKEICSYPKAKIVAVEGFLELTSMRCKKTSRKKSSGILGCSFTVYADENSRDVGLPVFIYTSSWLDGKNNRIDEPDAFTGKDIVFRDKNGNPLPKKTLNIYDNDGNLIPINSKIRIYGELQHSETCQIGMAKRIEKI